MGKTVVILGAGAGGRTAAEGLRATLSPADRIVLIDRSFTGSLGLSSLRVLAGRRTPEQVTTTLTPTALPGVSLVVGEVTGVDIDAQRVQYRQDGTDTGIGYDAALVALGAGLDTTVVPGLQAAIAAGIADQFYTPDGAAALRRRVATIEAGRIVVLIPALPFKCPPAPYEAAFLIAEQLGEKVTDGTVRVDVITAEPYPIPVVDPAVGQELVDMLEARGIGFRAGKTTAAINGDDRTVAFTDGSSESFDLLAVVPPHTSPVAALLPGAVNPGGWLPVDPTTLATALPGVWAIGDSTVLPLANGKPLPKAGVFAEAAAAVAADQIARYLGSAAPDTRFTGDGGCYLVVGGGQAARVGGHFLATPAPQVTLRAPTPEFHAEKEEQEREWLARWG
ncbi:MAG TPA: FAD/NAD(P)-binding oxidoreductase [Mycobacterium sp.]|nr:FAD/NAD(P)-binding oxidoreductase [Mycobacterium sp.]